MADKNLLSQMLAHLVEGDQAKAEELFHEYVVSQSREIYETLIESEMTDDEEEEEVEESTEEDSEEEKVDEEFEDISFEADDESEKPAFGGDETDDLESELDADDEMTDKDPVELFQDLDAIVDELQAKFDAMNGDEHAEPDADNMGGPSDMDADNEGFELETVREYVEKVPAGHGAEKKGAGESGADKSTSSLKFSKNDMGGTTANILSGRNGGEGSETGALKGNGLLKGNPKEDNMGNINVPGAKNGNAFSKKEPGHGAEKKGAAEGSTDGQSLFRGRR